MMCPRCLQNFVLIASPQGKWQRTGERSDPCRHASTRVPNSNSAACGSQIVLKLGKHIDRHAFYNRANFQVDTLKTEFFLFIQSDFLLACAEFCSPVPNPSVSSVVVVRLTSNLA